MVILIALFLVFFGFFAVFYSSAIDLFSTYLPEQLIFSMFPLGYLGWGLYSLLSLDASFLIRSVTSSVLAFMFGYVLFRFRQWASGDMWLLAAIFAILSPAFVGFSQRYSLYLVISVSIWSLLSYLFVLLVNDEWLKVLLLFLSGILVFITTPLIYTPLVLTLIFTGFFMLTVQKVKTLLEGGKEIRMLEEDDWPMEDIDVGFSIIRKTQPVTKYEGFLAGLSGIRKHVKVRLGIPLTPAFSIALIGLLL
ncbi:MAG: hypothetical protein GOV00_00040 [Candidatus Altiarchaeota archaeon]|nr:hypothetical protein [Candidatus Altiarchaeota archaeon]